MLNKRKWLIAIIVNGCLAHMGGILYAQDSAASNNVIVISRQGVTITGTITDAATRKEIAGARVRVDNFSATLSDSAGHFTLKVPSYTTTIIVEGEGYSSKRIPLKGRQALQVFLQDETLETLNGPVATPFGDVSKIQSTAAIGAYNINAGHSQPFELTDAMMQGRVAGLQVIRRSGAQGVGANMFLRGYNSLYATNKPLVVIDNMLFDANEYGESIIANNYTNPLALIDIKDIENISVLKDASSIYGTKGANGAIIITTAKAKTQATRIDFALYSGFNQAPKRLPVMNAADYRTYLHEILQSKGMSNAQIQAQPYMNDDPAAPLYTQYHFDTDWQQKVLTNSFNQNAYLKITGGDDIALYGLSMGFTKNNGIVKQTSLTRYNTRFNALFNFTKRFTGNTNLSFSYNEQDLKDQGIADKTAPVYLSLIKAPFLNDKDVNEKGVESPNLSDKDTFGITNPAVIVENMLARNKYYRFMGSFGFNYEISANWKASTTIGVVYDKIRENFFVPRKGIANDTLSNAVADSRMGTQVKRLFSIYNDTRIEYKKIYQDIHNFVARLGMRYQANKASQHYAYSYNSSTDDLTSVQTGVNALRQVGGGLGDWNWLSLYFNSEYDFRNKLFLTLNAAMDGSSRFGPQAPHGITFSGRKFPVMPSISAAWLVSSEYWMANTVLDLLKVRATFAIAGNDDIGNYNSGHTYTSQNLLGAQGLIRGNIANPALQWETVRKMNIGFDVAFWNERVNLSVDAYKHKTTNMLVYQPLSPLSGFEYTLTNDGSMQNTGFEVALNVRVVNGGSLKWDAGIQAATNKNKVLAVPGDRVFTPFAGATIITAVGKPANQFYGYSTNGVFATDAEAAGLQKKNTDGTLTPFKGGDMRFVDMDNNNIIDDNDRAVIGDPNPGFTGGFSNRIIWKRFELNALFTFSQGNDVYNYQRYRLSAASGIENQLQSVNNRWRAPGHVTTTPKATWGDPMGNSRFSDRWIEDGSYLRLRNISIQYNVPVRAGTFVKSFAVYGTATNVFTLTKYNGYDPEFSVTPGLFSQGIDTGLDPLYRNVIVGFRMGL
ncbi:SusC/RagA family TonB-linked outer membrane protein [Niastella sp. OAS944]|uniref:SusC/RagA family TonB-linked outer membrane protein n=1 Tax=Niastella sp. OAS944 TaxID=2664089 RepID=UPI003481CF7B|nr:TonB-linked SusC/RagA family outer membrane protein [Chitinophagaceae bacterium OAS944]